MFRRFPRFLRAFGVFSSTAMIAAACGSGSSPTNTQTTSSIKNGGAVTFAIDETIPGFNINTSADSEFVLQEVMNWIWPQTFIITPSLKPVLNTQFVTSAVVTSTSPETIVYKINPKAVWSDGVPITAADFIYNWQAQSGNPQYTDVGGKAYDDASTTGYQDISSVTGSNGGHTVTVVFKTQFGDWQSLFGNIVPAHIAKVVGWNTGFTDYTKVISGGPYMITNYVKDQTITLAENPRWWGTKPHLNTIVVRILSADSAGAPALQNNEVQIFQPSSPDINEVDQTKAIPAVTSKLLGGLEFEHFDFNQANFYLAQLPVRQAIAYGTNRQQIIQKTVGEFDPAIKPLGSRLYVPGQPQYVDNGTQYATVNVAKAKSLLEGAGMKMGTDGYYQPTTGPLAGKDLSFTISSTSGQLLRADTEQIFQANMQAIGIKINIQNYPAAQFFGTNLPGGNFDIAEFAWVATPFASSNQPLYCSYTSATLCGENWNHFANAQVDSLLNQAIASVSTTDAAKLYNQVDTILWQQMVTLPLYQKPQLHSWYTKYVNVIPNISSVGDTWNAPDWGLKASAS